MTAFEIIDLTLSLLTTAAVALAAIQIAINRKQLHLATISKCIKDFRHLGDLHQETNDAGVWKYIDIVSEELFYFKHDYIPKDVALEWIDGMIDYLPITKSGQVLNSGNCLKSLADGSERYFLNFPRIRSSFEVSGDYDFNMIYSKDKMSLRSRSEERKRLAKEILKNVKNSI